MDKIIIRKLSVYGYHGVFDEEKRLGQRFIIDLTLHVDLSSPARTDRLDQTINYVEACETVRDIVSKKRYHLMERLAGEIIDSLFDRFPAVQGVHVRVKKPSPPVDLDLEYLGVELERTRG